MKSETRMDYLMQRIADMNDLLATGQRSEDLYDQASPSESKKKKKSGKKGGTGNFGSAMAEMFFRRNSDRPASILTITDPSDGHPQEELTPDFGWFRPLSFNNPTWTLFWPELLI